MQQRCPENPFDAEGQDYALCTPAREPSSTNPERSIVRCLWCRRAILTQAMVPIDKFPDAPIMSGTAGGGL